GAPDGGGEVAQADGGAGGEVGELVAAVDRLHEREAALTREFAQLLEGLEADAARGDIEGAAGGEVVLGGDHHLEVGEGVLDLLLVVEGLAAEDAVGDPVLLEELLDDVA